MSESTAGRSEGRREGRAGGRAGGVGRDGSQKTRTPHRDVGKYLHSFHKKIDGCEMSVRLKGTKIHCGTGRGP